jgi:hypothetical protein
VFAAQRHADVAAAGLHDELPEVPLAERQPADAVALKSAEPLGAEPRLLPRDEGSRGVRQRIGDEADEGEPDETTSAPVSADDPAPATTLPSNNAIASPEDSLLAGMPPGDLPPELALMYELNIPGARSARAEESLRQSGFGDAELSWSRLLVSPQVAHRRQLLEVTGQMLRGSTQWLIWLSHDPEAEVRAAAVGRLITSQAPHVARRLLELECTESDPDICRQLKEWRAAELAGSDATVTKSPYR